MQIYVSKNGKQSGPYTRTQLYSYIQSGAFVGTDPAWLPGATSWTTIGDIPFTVDNVTTASSLPVFPLPTDVVNNPFPSPRSEQIRKVQIVKPGQLKASSDLPVSVRIERYFDRHNHKMEFIRTFIGLLTITLQLAILAKIFGLV